MYKYILILICLFSPNISQIYAPMSARTFELNVEDICSYQIGNSEFVYVEPCEKDYKCETLSYTSNSNGPEVGICRKYLQEETVYGSSCETDDDCEPGFNLKCENKICVLEKGSNAISFGGYHYCPNKDLIALDDSSGFKCYDTADYSDMKGLCELSGESKRAHPDYMKVCGEIELDTENNNAFKKTNMNYIGSVSDGKFVENELACKSGFALKFYLDGEITSTTSGATSHLKCVKYNGVEYKKNNQLCKIKYYLDNKSLYYDVEKASNDFFNGITKGDFCEGLKYFDAKLELFNQYASKVTELGDQCQNIKYYDEPFTCKNDELRKLYYFYNNIEVYLLYKNEDEITEFLLQQEYPSYGVKYSKTDASNYLSNNLICLLFFLLL